MSRTLNYAVQRVMEKLDLDPINSINDSPDSILVAREAEDTLYDLFNRNDWPSQFSILEVESMGDTSNPTGLRLPENVTKVCSVRYNVTTASDTDTIYKELKELEPEEFLRRSYNLKSSDTDTQSSTYSSSEFFIKNDKMPEYFTVMDNSVILCDSFDNTVESTLQGAKTVCRAASVPTFVMDDDYVLPLDHKMFPLFLAELTSACSLELVRSPAPEAERRRNRGMSQLREHAYRTNMPNFKNNFGR